MNTVERKYYSYLQTVFAMCILDTMVQKRLLMISLALLSNVSVADEHKQIFYHRTVDSYSKESKVCFVKLHCVSMELLQSCRVPFSNICLCCVIPFKTKIQTKHVRIGNCVERETDKGSIHVCLNLNNTYAQNPWVV